MGETPGNLLSSLVDPHRPLSGNDFPDILYVAVGCSDSSHAAALGGLESVVLFAGLKVFLEEMTHNVGVAEGKVFFQPFLSVNQMRFTLA